MSTEDSGSWAISGGLSSARGKDINSRVLCEILSSHRINKADTFNEKELSICIFLYTASFQIFPDHMWIQHGFDDSCYLISWFTFSFKLETEEEKPNEKDYCQKKMLWYVFLFK